jgi:hypothetical protein
LGPDAKSSLIGQLLAASTSDPTLKSQLKTMYDGFLILGEKELSSLFPDAKKTKIRQCVYGILCLTVGNDALISSDISYSNKTFAERCAGFLIEDLRQNHFK